MSYYAPLTSPPATNPPPSFPLSAQRTSPSTAAASSPFPSYPSHSPASLPPMDPSPPHRDAHSSSKGVKQELTDTDDEAHFDRRKSPHHHQSDHPSPSMAGATPAEWEKRVTAAEEKAREAQARVKEAQERAEEAQAKALQLEREVAQLRAQLESISLPAESEGKGEGVASRGGRGIVVVSDTRNSDGHVSCHRCKTRKDSQDVMVCHSQEGRCAKKYCAGCLTAWHQHAPGTATGSGRAGAGSASGSLGKFEKVEGSVTEMGEEYKWWQPEHRKGWRCPACMGCCHCHTCQTKYRDSLYVQHQPIEHADVKKAVQEEAAKRFRSLQHAEAGIVAEPAQHTTPVKGAGEGVDKKANGRRSTTPYQQQQQQSPPLSATPPPNPRMSPAPPHMRGESASSSTSMPALSREQTRSMLENFDQLPASERHLALKQMMAMLDQQRESSGEVGGGESPQLSPLQEAREHSPLSLHPQQPEQAQPLLYPASTAVPAQYQPRPPGLDGELPPAFIEGAAFYPGTHARASTEQHRVPGRGGRGSGGHHGGSPSHELTRPPSQPHNALRHHQQPQPQPHYPSRDAQYSQSPSLQQDGYLQQQQAQTHQSGHSPYEQPAQSSYPQAPSQPPHAYSPVPVVYSNGHHYSQSNGTSTPQPLSSPPQPIARPRTSSPPHVNPSPPQPSYALPPSAADHAAYSLPSNPSSSYPSNSVYPPPSTAPRRPPYDREARQDYMAEARKAALSAAHQHQQPQPHVSQRLLPPLLAIHDDDGGSVPLDGFAESYAGYERLTSQPLSPSAFADDGSGRFAAYVPALTPTGDGGEMSFLNSDSIGSQAMQMSGASLYQSQPNADDPPPRRLSDVFTPLNGST